MSTETKTITAEASGVSRRGFLKVGTGAVAGMAAATALAGAGCAQEAQATEIKKAMGHIETNPLKCAGCRVCVAVCSLNHEGICGPAYSRIRVYQPAQNIFDTTIITCKQCDNPNCLVACPTGALHVDDTTGARVIDQKKCIGCMSCVKACPQYPNSPIYYDTVSGTCFKCDLCGGDPQCVRNCTMSVSFSEHCYPENEHPLRFTAEVAQTWPTTWEEAHDPNREPLYPPEMPKANA